MSNQRKLIRAKAASLLVAGATAASDRVFPSRTFPLWKNQFPVIYIYTPSEDNTILGQFPTVAERRLRVAVQSVFRNVDADCEDEADDLANEIEAILDADDNWQLSTINRTEFIGTEIEVVQDEQADAKYVSMTMNFDVYYETNVEPETPDDVETVEVNGNDIPE